MSSILARSIFRYKKLKPASYGAFYTTFSLPMSDPPTQKKEVLTLCSLPTSLNVGKMKELMEGYMNPRKQFYLDTNRAIFVEDEFSEYFTAKATNGKMIGSGHCAMDVKTSVNEGIDDMCVIMNKNQSNEKSVVQNFKTAGANLDVLFKEKKDKEAVKLFMDEYSKKLKDVKQEKNLTDLYILAFVSTFKEVYLVCFKINMENIPNVSSVGFIGAESCVNVTISDFINPAYGNVKLYKSKKRVELRLLPAVLQSSYAVKIYSMDSPMLSATAQGDLQ